MEANRIGEAREVRFTSLIDPLNSLEIEIG